MNFIQVKWFGSPAVVNAVTGSVPRTQIRLACVGGCVSGPSKYLWFSWAAASGSLNLSMCGSHAPDYSTRRVACGQRLASSGFKIFILVFCMWRLLRFAVVVPAAPSRPDMSGHARLKQFVPLLLELFKCAWECICKHLVKPHIRIATKPFGSLTGGSRAEQLQIHWGNQCPID